VRANRSRSPIPRRPAPPPHGLSFEVVPGARPESRVKPLRRRSGSPRASVGSARLNVEASPSVRSTPVRSERSGRSDDPRPASAHVGSDTSESSSSLDVVVVPATAVPKAMPKHITNVMPKAMPKSKEPIGSASAMPKSSKPIGSASAPKAKVAAKPQPLTKASLPVGLVSTSPNKPNNRKARVARDQRGSKAAAHLARRLVQLLRHGRGSVPTGFQMNLDKDGWLSMDEVQKVLALWHVQDVEVAVREGVQASGGRLELSEKGMRANTGHTLGEVRATYPTVKSAGVPEKLYHSTNEAAVKRIRQEGLKSAQLQGVTSGRRHVYFWDRPISTNKRPLVLEIAARLANQVFGVVFVKEDTRGVFLTAMRVPLACIRGPIQVTDVRRSGW
jgi:RNA:NAD 2'-phosphotransferase (TPT1/KptA family)